MNDAGEKPGESVVELMARGVKLQQSGKIAEALKIYDQVLAIEPEHFAAHLNIGSALRSRKQFAAASAATRIALGINPDSAAAWGNLGNCLKDMGQFTEAIACHTRAVELCAGAGRAAEIGAWNNLGVTLRAAMRPNEALSCFDRVLAMDPENAEARFDRALTLLTLGEFERGWAEYESRWQLKRNPPRKLPGQPWRGESVAGKTIFVHAEQGLGDALQFVRFLPRLTGLGARVVLECRPELFRLFQSASGVDGLIRRDEPPPAYDFYCPLQSLPARLGLRLPADIAVAFPYLHAPAGAGEKFAQALAPTARRRFNVGITWAGSPTFGGDRERSVGLDAFLPLAAVQGVRLFSLQIGPRSNELKRLGSTRLIGDLAPLIEDFADTAAAIQRLDLVIAVDTSVVHLTGAINRPGWVLLPYFSEPRWLLGREDSPWYPSLRLFRMTKYDDWQGVVGRAARALTEVAGAAANAAAGAAGQARAGGADARI